MSDEFNEAYEGMREVKEQALTLGADMATLKEKFGELSGETAKFASSLQRDLSGAIKSLVVEGSSARDVLKSMALSIADKSFDASLKPVTSMAADGIGMLVQGAFGAPVTAHAKGGVVNSPTRFPMSNGVGLMGEAGAEAIMPLARDAQGRLGVSGQSGGNVTVNVNVSTNDAASFQKSQTQILAQLRRAIASEKR